MNNIENKKQKAIDSALAYAEEEKCSVVLGLAKRKDLIANNKEDAK